MPSLQFASDLYKLLADALERLQHLCLVHYFLLVSVQSLGCSLNGETLDLQECLDIFEGFQIFLCEETVSLRVSLRMDVLREAVRPETDA